MPRDINSKMDILVIKNRPPIASEGSEGDLTVRNIRGGLKLYVKYKNVWEGVSLSQRPFHIDRVGNVNMIKDLTVDGNVTASSMVAKGGTTTVQGVEGGNASLYLKSDESDDAGDDWLISANQATNTLTIGNDIASAGTNVSLLTIVPHATKTSSTVTLAGSLRVVGGGIEVKGIEGGTASLTLQADESDDNGDDYLITSVGNGRLTISNDISGLGAVQIQIDANATLTAGLTAINTRLRVDSGMHQIQELGSSPAHASGYGTLWVKDDAPTNLYYEDDTGTDFLLNNTPGTIVGYTHLLPATQTEQAATGSYETIHDDALVEFLTPQSEAVRIDFQAWLEEGSGAASTYLALSTANKTDGYATLNARFENIANYGRLGDGMLQMSWVVEAAYLEAIGINNRLWVGFKTNPASTDESIWWGGTAANRFPPMIITATAL